MQVIFIMFNMNTSPVSTALDFIALPFILFPGNTFKKYSDAYQRCGKATSFLVDISASNPAKAFLLAGSHLASSPWSLIDSEPKIINDWFGDGKAPYSVVLGSLLFGGIALCGKKFKETEYVLHTLFSITAGYHHLKRSLLIFEQNHVQKEKQTREMGFETLMILFFSTSPVLLERLGIARWIGLAFCAVDDVLPGLVTVSKQLIERSPY